MIDKAYNRELSLIFRATVVTDVVKKGSSSFMSYVLDKSGFLNELSQTFTLAEVFEAIYNYLIMNYRSEYVYKNAIANQLLLGRHLYNEAVLINEFWAGNSKADSVILNGTSTVYEIKTELDNLDRLPNQLNDYQMVFEHVYVVTNEANTSKVLSVLPKSVGIIVLTADYKLETCRESKSNKPNVQPEKMFDALRRDEYTSILLEKFGYVPDVPNTLIYSECKPMFMRLSPEEAHDALVKAVRKRIPKPDVQTFIESMPPSMKTLGFSVKLPKKHRLRFIEMLNQVYSNH